MKSPNTSDEVLQFPVEIDVKIFIKNNNEDLAIVRQFVDQQWGEGLKRCSVRDSKGGKYLAITALVLAQSRAQIDAFYQGLTDHPNVIMSI